MIVVDPRNGVAAPVDKSYNRCISSLIQPLRRVPETYHLPCLNLYNLNNQKELHAMSYELDQCPAVGDANIWRGEALS